MGFDKQEVHRAGVFKKANKSHKTGRHRSKGSIANDNQGTTYCSFL
jgi:pre-rRNA-processing protein TSR1